MATIIIWQEVTDPICDENDFIVEATEVNGSFFISVDGVDRFERQTDKTRFELENWLRKHRYRENILDYDHRTVNDKIYIPHEWNK